MKYTDEEMTAYFFDSNVPKDWPKHCQAMFAQVRAERDELREALKFCLPWAEVGIDQLDSTAIAGSRLKQVREYKKLLTPSTRSEDVSKNEEILTMKGETKDGE